MIRCKIFGHKYPEPHLYHKLFRNGNDKPETGSFRWCTRCWADELASKRYRKHQRRQIWEWIKCIVTLIAIGVVPFLIVFGVTYYG